MQQGASMIETPDLINNSVQQASNACLSYDSRTAKGTAQRFSKNILVVEVCLVVVSVYALAAASGSDMGAVDLDHGQPACSNRSRE